MTGKIEITHDIPPPPPVLRKRSYPWQDMGVNDSMLVPCDEGERNSVRTAMATSARKRFPNWKFLFRIERDEAGKIKGIRAWRTK